MTYEQKRFTLEALKIRVLIDGEIPKLEGVITLWTNQLCPLHQDYKDTMLIHSHLVYQLV